MPTTKKKVGRPPKKEEEKLVRMTINLLPECVEYLRQKSQERYMGGMSAYARMLLIRELDNANNTSATS